MPRGVVGKTRPGTGENNNMPAASKRAKPREVSPDRLRFGIIGVGVMGSNHARVLAELPGVELVAIADPDRSLAMKIAKALHCDAVADHNTLIGLGLDAVIVAAPTHLHHSIPLDCIEAGIALLVEKPIAPTVEEGRQIVDAA